MSRVDFNLEDIFDQIFIKMGESLFPTFRKIGMTANGITLISYIPSILTVYYLVKKEYHLAAMMYLLQYIMDCWDGNYARTYKEESKLGDKLDHYRDITLGIIVAYFLYKNWSYNNYHLILLVILAFGCSIHANCMSKYYSLQKSNTYNDVLNPVVKICYANDKEDIIKLLGKVKFIGGGTLIVYVSYLLYNLKK